MSFKLFGSNGNGRNRVRRFLVVTAALMAVFAITAAASAQEPEPIIDDLGNEVELDERPQRIVSLSPATTEKIFGLGLGDRVVGVTTYCDYPPEMLERVEEGEISTIGTVVEPNMEAIVELDPDLVVAASVNPIEDVERLIELGENVAGFAPDDLDSALSAMENVGRVTGFQEETQEVISRMETRLEEVESLVAEQEEEPTVFYEIWSDPLQTAGAGTFIDDLIEIAGAKNIGAEAGEGWPEYSLESLIMEDPEVYVSTPHSAPEGVTVEEIKERQHFDALTAVQEGKVALVDQDKLSRAGPRLIDGLIELTAAIHPEIAEELEDI